ncbi:E3 ubiquitin protein ligase DRIP2 [Striga hermonthica]|uniref:E3 ubiquitin protein ligase DRIP2 n=1 Tax=Striga hermonthica TaxID=68872 RepID=A0A9N7NDP5_STRHE|nr:E3 ubiquitin protein ligase DRIP2 [Striga hermonthica]
MMAITGISTMILRMKTRLASIARGGEVMILRDGMRVSLNTYSPSQFPIRNHFLLFYHICACSSSRSYVSIIIGGRWFGLGCTMPHQVVSVRREAVAPCMTCPLCYKLIREATTVIECLHTFCRKCIHKNLSDEEMECCPVCSIDLGCSPLEKLRPDHNLQDVRGKIFPYKRIKARASDIVPPVTLPAKRKERSLSSLGVSTPRVSSQGGLTGRRSKSTARKASSKGTNFTSERPMKREDDSMDEQPESSGSPDTLRRYTQNIRQCSASGEPSNRHSPDMKREDQSGAWEEGKVDLWKPLNCLVEAASRTKPLKLNAQGPSGKSEARESEGQVSKSKSREHRQKAKAQEENAEDHTPPEPGRPKKMRRARQKKAQNYGESMVSPQAVLDAASTKSERKSCPIWFSLVSDEKEGNALSLPQIPANYLRIKDGSIPVSFVQKYVKMKLNLPSEDEVEIKCMGQKVCPTCPLHNVVDMWLQTTTTDRVAATIGSSAKEFVMVLGYSRKAPDS